MLNFGVEEHEGVTVDVEGEIFKFHRTAVETHQMVFLAENGCELVHDTAVHAAIIVFGRLADAGEFEFVDGVAVEEVVKSESEAAFKSGRRAKARTEGNITGKHGVEAFHGAAAFDYFTANAEYIACPLLLGSVFFIEAELGIFVDID